MLRKQNGITLIGFVVVLCVLGFFAYAAMKLVPVYATHMGVVKSMNMLKSEPDIAQKPVEQIRQELNLKFSTQYVEDDMIPPQQIQLKKQGGNTSLRIFYDRRVPFMYNVDLLVHFDNTVDLSHGQTY